MLFFKREGSDGLMEIERAKQSFNTFFEDVFSARNIIETSLRFWKFILLLAVLGAVGATLLTMFVIRPSYTAQATLFAWRVDDADENSGGNPRYSYQNLTVGGMLTADYQILLTSNRVQDQVREKLIQRFGEKVKYSVKANYTRNTRIVAINAVSPSPEVAQFAAQTTVEVFADVIEEIMKFNNVQVIDDAKLPLRAVNIRPLRNGAVGGFLGLVAGFVLAMLFGMMDQTIQNPEQVDSFFDKSMLGVIPLVKDKIPDEPLYSLLESKEHTDLAEAFRLARANLPYLCPDAGKDGQGARVFLFTSTAKSEGKSNCIASLAYLTASAGKKVLLIDSDLRRPMLGKIFDQSHSQHGIVTYLTGESSWDDALVRDVANLPLDVLPCSKPLPPNPSEILMSNSFSEMIRRERANYDYIFIDGAPALFLADPLIVVPMADAVVFVIACSRAKIGLIRQTLRQIAQISEKTPIGLLVNRFDRSDISCKYGYYRYKDYDRYYHYQKSYYVSDTQE